MRKCFSQIFQINFGEDGTFYIDFLIIFEKISTTWISHFQCLTSYSGSTINLQIIGV